MTTILSFKCGSRFVARGEEKFGVLVNNRVELRAARDIMPGDILTGGGGPHGWTGGLVTKVEGDQNDGD